MINPIAFEWGSFRVHWYGILIGFGALFGLYLATRECKRRGVNPDTFVDLILWVFPFAILSARSYYVLFEWHYYQDHLSYILAIWKGGLAIHGGLIGAVVTATIFCRIKKVSFWQFADIGAPSLILAQAIGRWGNFINQEAHGGEVTRSFLEGLHLPAFIINQMQIDGTYYHPTFLYESLWCLLGFGVLLVLRKVNLRRGELFLSYGIWYSVGRFFIESLRTDSLMLTEHLRMAQVISVGIIVLCVLAWFIRRRKGLAKEHYLNE